MHSATLTPANRGSPLIGALVVAAAAVIAVISARPHAGSWQDGSRLAIAEALVDQHTFAIDHSVFVQVPAYPDDRGPYPPDEPGLLKSGTSDKVFIHGHYYSDRPVPALLMAGLYEVWQRAGGTTARERPDAFCRMMTLGTTGLAYVIAVWCVYRLGTTLRLGLPVCLGLTVSFALATVALPYSRNVNTHMMLLGVGAALFLGVAPLAEEASRGTTPRLRLAWLGTLAGLGYTMDLGAGPVLLACLLALVAWRFRRLVPVALVVAGAMPWLVTHHAINYAIGGTFRPMNSVPEYFLWPGCPFTPENLTGSWKHGIGHFFVYAAALLLGKRGFIGHNLPLFLTLPALVVFRRRQLSELPEVLFAAGWCAGTWLLYAALSNNYSGACCSVRWFVPLLAPAYYTLAVFLRECPSYRRDFSVLSAWGMVLAGIMWWHGPWLKHMVPIFWPLQAAALLSWFVCRQRQRRLAQERPAQTTLEPDLPAHAA
ncbi:MAG TPA: hypothetical protein VG013_20390 [Gemmataceae bacterium]|jgi:hypothetical protein|nr:hypothetical protein [Gemmataceae bacterium]